MPQHQITSAHSADQIYIPDSKVHEANMGPIWGRQDPGGSHVGSMNFAIWGCIRPPISKQIYYIHSKQHEKYISNFGEK